MYRLNILYGDWHAVKANIKAAKLLCDEGGDWERKNKLKVGRLTPRCWD
jgi:26S proteasome regulatory subunit N7